MINSWALVNILLAFVIGILSLVFLCKKKDEKLTPYQRRKVYFAKSVGIEIGIVACLICLFGESDTPTIDLVDKWTIIMLMLFGAELCAGHFIDKKCHETGLHE